MDQATKKFVIYVNVTRNTLKPLANAGGFCYPCNYQRKGETMILYIMSLLVVMLGVYMYFTAEDEGAMSYAWVFIGAGIALFLGTLVVVLTGCL